MTYYQQFQLEKYGNILLGIEHIETENGEISVQEFTEWVEREAEKQLND